MLHIGCMTYITVVGVLHTKDSVSVANSNTIPDCGTLVAYHK